LFERKEKKRKMPLTYMELFAQKWNNFVVYAKNNSSEVPDSVDVANALQMDPRAAFVMIEHIRDEYNKYKKSGECDDRLRPFLAMGASDTSASEFQKTVEKYFECFFHIADHAAQK
jgi:hypothetical protein